MTELRLGQNEKGIETLKGGITLASKVLMEGYRSCQRWDLRGTVRANIRAYRLLLNQRRGGKGKYNSVNGSPAHPNRRRGKRAEE